MWRRRRREEIAAVNHLEGKTGYVWELLRDLSDRQLEEQIAYYREKYAESGPTGVASWQFSKLLSAAISERRDRSTAPARSS